MKRWFSLLFVLALLASACSPIQAPAEPAGDAPAEQIEGAANDVFAPDPAVRIGTLDNGLTYYIRHNDEPMNRAELWLAVNAGSVLEDDDQEGLAHFLEHMLFNGTENFPEFGVVDFLESIGMEFGPDVNAHTSFDETVYTIQVPTEDPEVVDKGFQVLADWATRATLDADAIDQERGVIVEEWRLGQQTAQGRISEKLLPFILGDSRYSARRPIGDMDDVRTAPREAFTRFYEDWYRPDLMSVIAVGDFDVDEVEAMIREQFGVIAAPEQPKERTVYDLPQHEGTRYSVITDPEESNTRLVSFTLRPANPIRTVADLREDVIADLFYIMLNNRLDEIARQPDAPFLSAGSGTSGLVRPVSAAVISAQLQEEKALDAMESLITEIERVRRHGFTETEMARAEQELLKFYEQQYNERENTASRTYADDFQDNYLEGEAIPSIEVIWETVQALIPEITIEEVNEAASLLATNENRVIYLTGPEKEETPFPTEEELAAVVTEVESIAIDPYVDSVAGSELMPVLPEPAAIVEEGELPGIGVKTLTLENGVQVLLKQTDFKDDEIVFNAVSPGGSSLVTDEDFPEASTIDDVVNESGLGEFTQTELVKLLAGKSVMATPYIRELAEGIEGKTTPADLETLFQLIHLYFTAPRADEDAFEVFRTKQRTALINREQDPNAALSDALNEALYGDTIRRGVLPVEEIDALDLARGFEIYQDRFADAGDFTFTFAGNFDEETIRSYAQTYLGTLPVTDREESWKDVASDLPQEVVEAPVYKGEGERSIVQLVFTGPAEPTRQTELELNAVAGVLDIMLREKLREELGGVYSSGAYGFTSELPDSSYFLVVSFGTDPGRVEELVDATFAEIEALKSDGPSAENVQKIIAQQASGHEEELETNAFWSTTLKNQSFYGGDKLDVLSPEYEEIISGLNAEAIQAAAQEFLQADRYVEAVLYPESYDPDAQ